MLRRRLSLTLLLLSLALSIFAAAEMARPVSAVTNNSHLISTAPTSDHYVYESSYQNPGFYANGLYWVFYEDSAVSCEGQGGCFYYVTSSDGTSWSLATKVSTLGNTGIHVTDSDWSVANSGNQVFYARYNESAFDSDCNRALLYGSGTISGGSITWQPEQVVRTPNPTSAFPNEVVTIDSNNPPQVWIGYQEDSNKISCGGTSGHQTARIVHANNQLLPSSPISSGFTFTPPNPLPSLQNVNFSAAASGGNSPYTYTWSFGDGSPNVAGQNVSHNYTAPGPYGVSLTTKDSQQQTVNTTRRMQIGPGVGTQTNGLTLTTPSSLSVRTGSSIAFTVSASDSDSEPVTLSNSTLPAGAIFVKNTGKFTWTPTADQSNKIWAITFIANDTGTPSLYVTNQVLIEVSPLWTGDIPLPASTLSQSISANWHVDIAALSSGQVYAGYWADTFPLFGRLYDGSNWLGEDQVSLTTQSTDVNSFIFASGTSVYAVWFDTNKGTLNSGVKPPGVTWQQNVIGPGEAKSVLGLPGNVNGHRYSLPFTASFDSADSRIYVFWYNQANKAIDEWSGFGGGWSLTPNAFATQPAVDESSIGSFHYSVPVNGQNTIGIVWIDGATTPYRLNFGLETVGSIPTFQTDTSWNPKVACTPIVVTIEQILGSQRNASSGGATESGSIFNPGIQARSPGDAKRWLTPTSFTNTLSGWQQGGPPCTITNADGQNVSAFVEVRGVQRTGLTQEDPALPLNAPHFDPVNGGGLYPNPIPFNDTTFNIYTPGFGVCTTQNTTGCMHTIHMEFDHDWKEAGYCGPNTVCDPTQLANLSASDKTLIDFQGFIYWDPDHVGEANHAFSGWEMHPLTAWRISCLNGQFCNPTYTLAASPSVLTVIPNQKANSTITVNTFNLFTGPLPLSATVTPTNPSDPTVTFTPNPVNVPPCNQCGAANSTLTVTALSSSTGTYIVTITGPNCGPLCQTTVTVQVQGFSLSANPSSLTIPAGGSVNSTITVTSLGSFSGQVSLSATASGCACGFTTKFTPGTVNLAVGGKQNATLTVTAGSQTGNVVITVIGASGTLSASTTIAVVGVDFTISASPTSSTVLTNRLANSTITVAAVNGFKGPVTFTDTVPTGLICSLSPSSVTLNSTAPSGAVSLKCSGQVGNYNVIVTGSSNSISHAAIFAIRIQDFTIAASPVALMVNAGSSGTSTILVTAVNGFVGTVGLNQNGGTVCSLSVPSVTLTSSATSASLNLTCTYATIGNNSVLVVGSSGPLVHNATITFQVVDFAIIASPTSLTLNAGSLGNSTVTLTALNGFNRTVTLSFSAQSAITCLLSPNKVTLIPSPVNSVLSCRSSTASDYTVIVTGTNGTLSHATAAIVFHIVDFTSTPNIPTLTLLVGQESLFPSVHYASLNGFAGTLTISVITTPSGPSGTPLFPSLKLTASGNSTGIDIKAGQIAGVYTLNITATYGQLAHSTIITLIVQDFKILPSPAIVTVLAGTAGTSTITVTGLNGFSGTVALSNVVSPLAGLTCNLSPTSVVLSATVTNGNSTLSCSGSTGTYTVTITGSSNGIAHTATVTYKVQDFTVSANPTSVTVFLGNSATSTITGMGLQGFTGTVALTLTVSPSVGLSCVLNPASFAFNTTTTSRTSTLSCSDSALSGTFNVTITGTGNGLARSTSVKYTVGTAFTVTANPSSVAVLVGSTGTTTISVTYSPTFIGTVTLNDTVSPSTGLSCALSVTTFTASGNSTLSCSGSAAQYTVTVNGSSGGNTASTTVIYRVQDFTISASPTTVNVNAGATGTSTITITALNGFSGIVSIASTISPTTGLTCTLTPTSITGSGSSTLSCSGIAGVYTVTVTGTSSALSHSATATFTVQDFTIVASPTSAIVLASTSGTSTITVAALDGFAGVVSLTSSVSPATGLTCTLTPTSVTGSGTSTLSCSGTAGSFTVTVTGTSGTLSHSATVTYTVQDFTIAASPTGVTVIAGTAGTSTVTVTALQGFSGVVSLTSSISPANTLACTLTPASVTGSGISTLSCNGSAGAYTVTVTGTSGILSHSATVTYTVQDFTVTTNPPTLSFPSGGSGNSGVTVASRNGFAGTVTLTIAISPSAGLTCSLSSTSVTLSSGGTGASTLSCSSSTPGTFTVTVTGTASGLTTSAIVSINSGTPYTVTASPTTLTVLAGAMGSSTITVSPQSGFTGTVSLTSSVSPASGLTCTLSPTSITLGPSGTSTLSCSGSAGVYTVAVTGTNGPNAVSATVSYAVQDFTLFASPTSVPVLAGVSGTSTVTETALQGFSGVVSLTAVVSPSTGLACSLTPTSVTGSGTSTLSCSGSAGAYAVTVTGTSSSLSHSATVTYTVQDFTIAASPTSVTANAGTAGTSTITITALQSFSGVVSLTATISPITGLNCTFTPTSLTGSGTSTLSCNGSVGAYTLTVTGTSSSLSHSVTVSYSVKDFTVAASPSTVAFVAGSSGTSTITVTAVNGFTGSVSLSAAVAPSSGLSCTLTPTSVTLGASGSSTLSCSGSAGTYTVTVTGTSGTVSRTATVTYSTQDFTLASNPTSLTTNTGTAGTSTITVTAVNGFTSLVSLTADNTACSVTPTSVTGSGTATLSCTFATASNILVTVTGASGSQSRTATVSYTVQDFTIAANPTSVTVNAGTTGTSIITVTGQNGFAGTVNLGTNSTSCTISPNTVTGSGTANLSCTFASSNTIHVGVTGTSGLLSHSVTITFTPQDFSIAAAPTSVPVNAGSAGGSTITVTALNGFTAVVNLSSNNSACTLTPSTITGSGSASLSCNFASVSTINVLVTGASGSLSHTVTVTYTVQDFTITVNPTSVTGNAGSTVTSTITVTSLDGFAGSVGLATNSTSCVASPASVTGSGSSTLSCSFASASIVHVTVTGTNGGLSHSATATFTIQDFTISLTPTTVVVNAGTAGTSTVTISAQNGFGGVVGFATNSTACAASPTSVTGSGSATLSCTFPSASTVHIAVTGTSASLSHSVTITYRVQDFTITGNPTSVNVNVGSAGTSSLAVTALNGFSGVVSLNTNSTSCSAAPNSVAGSGSSILSCTFSATSMVHVSVTGTSGTLSHSAIITFTVQDFSISASPTTVSGIAGSGSASSVTVTPVNGFSATVTLAVTSNSTSLSCTVNPTSITSGSGSSTLSCTGSQAGNYLATVTGSSGGLSHSVGIIYHIQDFGITVSPANVSVTTGTGGQSTITIAPLNGFSGGVSLTQTTNSTSLLCNVNPPSINGGSGTSTLLCTGSSSGNYAATITAISGALSHSATVVYAVADFAISSPSPAAVTIGTSATSTITVTALNGFTGTVSLTDSASSGLTCGNLAPQSITGSGTATVACSSTIAGNYSLSITGTSGTLSHSASATVTVTDFSVAATSPGPVDASIPATSTISINSVNGFTGTISLTDSVPTGLNCTPISQGSVANSGTASVSCSSTTAATYTLSITGTSGTLSHSASATFVIDDFTISANPTSLTGNVGSPLSSTITVSPANGFAGSVALTFTISPTTGIGCSLSPTAIPGGSGSSTLSCNPSAPGSYTVTVKGTSGSLLHSATVTFSINVPDFSISASPTSVTSNAGSAVTATITISSVNAFPGTVNLTSSISPSTGLTCTLSPTSVILTPGSSGTSTLSCSGSAGLYAVTVTGTSGVLSHSANVAVTVQDFSVTNNPTSVTVNAGSVGTSTVFVTSIQAFTGTVTLTTVISPVAGLSCTLSPTSVTLGSTVTSTLSCTGSSGTYTVTVTGTGGSLTHTSIVNYTVQDFTISASPTSVTVLASASGTSTITVIGVQGLAGTVSLSTTISPSTGLACSTSPTSIPLTSTASSGTSTLSCSGASGSYTVTITGSDGSLSHNAIVTFTVQDFSVTANPASVTVSSGSAGTSTITVSGFNGFTGTVSLAAGVSPSTGLTCTLSPTSVSLGAITSGTSTLSCTGNLGTYTVTVTGTGSSLSHSASVTYTVQDFTVTASPASVLVFSGAGGASTVTVSSANGFTGTVSLTDTISPSSGLTCSLSPASITLTTTSSSGTSTLSCTPSVTSTTFTVSVTGTSVGLTRSATVTYNVGTAFSMTANPTSVTDVAGSSGSSTITVAFAPGFSGTVTLSSAVSPTSGLSCSLATPSLTSSGTSTLACSGQAGFYTVTVTGTNGANSASATVTYTVQDFGLTATSTSVTALAGAAGSTTVIATGLDGFAGNVALSTTVSPSNGLNCNLTPSVLPLSATASSATSSLSCSGAAGSYTVTVTGTSSGLTHSVSISYTVQDFAVAASPTSVTVLASASGTSAIAVTGLQGFAGTISLSVAISPPSGLACTSSPNSVSLTTSTASGQSTLSCSGSAGLYTVTVTGTSSGLTHAATLAFAVQDHTVSASPTTLSILAGASGSSTITVSGIQGFSGTISLSAAVSPTTGLTCTLSPASVVLSISAPSTTSTLSCSGSAGSYTVTTTGTSGSLTHSATVAVTIQDFAIAVNLSTVTVNSGVNGLSTIIVTSTQGFTGTVDLTSSVSPATGLACTLSPTTVTLGPSGTSALSCSGQAGTYTVSVTGTSGASSHSATVTFVVQDFTIAASPTSVAVNVNQAGTSTITITAVNGFTGAVSLTNTISRNGMTCTHNPTSIAGSGTSILSCTASTSGTFTVTVTGTSGTLSHSATVSYSVAVPDFSVTANPTNVSVIAGTAGTSTITVTSINGFTGTVSLTSSVSPSTGLSCTLTPTSVTLGTSGTSNLSCTGSAGTYTVTVTGSNGILSHSAPVTYTIQDFTVTAGPVAVTVNAGTAGTSTITITALPAFQGFIGAVTIAATTSPSTGLTCILTPTTVNLGSSGTSTLSCNGTAGSYTVTVTGTSSGLSHSATVTYNVQDFIIASSLTTLTALVGQPGTSTIAITSQQGFNGLVGVTSAVSPATGLTCNLTPTSVTGSGSSILSCSGNVGSYTVTVTGTSGSLSHTAAVTFAVTDFAITANPTAVTLNVGTAGTSTITVAPINGFTGTVNLITNSTSCNVSPTSLTGSGSATLSCTFSSASTIHVSVTGASASRSHAATVTYTVQDFTLAAGPTAVSVTVGTAGNSTLTISSVNGFAGQVGLTSTASPPTGLSCTLTPTSVAGSGTSTVSCPSSASGTFTLTVIAANGSLSHSVTITISVGKASPSLTTALTASTILAGSSVTDSAVLTNGFEANGTVTYEYFTGASCSGTPTTVGGPVAVTAGLVPNSASQKFNSAGSFGWEAGYSGDANNNGTTSACTSLTVMSPPALQIPGAQTVTPGGTIQFHVNATGTGGCNGVTLTPSNLPAGATFVSTQCFAGAASSVFSWTPTDAQASSDYTVTFTAKDARGAVTSAQVTIHVSPVSKAAPLPILTYSVFGIVGFFAVVLVALVLRRIQTPRRKP